MAKKNTKSKTNPVPFWRPTKLKFIGIAVCTIPLILALVTGLVTINVLSEDLPSLEQLENIEPRLITKLYDRDSQLVHEFFVEKREWIALDSISPHIKHAVLAIEDRVFYKHWGINVWTLPGVLFDGLTTSRRLRGGSTLTQQLAKNLFLTPERSIARKIREALTAIKIEATYTKDEILEFYLNAVYLGGGHYGFQSAAKGFFGVGADSVTPLQAAVLAGMLSRPERLRPDFFPNEARTRANVVLNVMGKQGFLSQTQLQSSLTDSLIVASRKEREPTGAYYIEEVRKYIERHYGFDGLYSDGLNIYTTLDLQMQQYMDQALVAQLDSIQRRLAYRHASRLELHRIFRKPLDTIVANMDEYYHRFDSLYLSRDTSSIDSLRRYPDSLRYRKVQGAAILIENKTGAILAMTGGRDFSVSKYNRATQAMRQPGSAFKSFVFALAMDNGAAPSDSVNDQPITIPHPSDPERSWRPQNYDQTFEGMMTYRRALFRSKNLPAIQIAMRYGLNNLVSYSRRFGITSRLDPVPSLAIGSIGATLQELTSAHTVFPNGGMRLDPHMIKHIANRSGTVLETTIASEHEVLRRTSAYLMVDMLRDVNIRGTGARIWASGFRIPSAGKTGTTNDYTDAWYIGFTPHYTMGVWIGVDNHRPIGRRHTGGSDAMPIWLDVMQQIYKDTPEVEDFAVPPGIVTLELCNITGKIASAFCTQKSREIFSEGNEPDSQCSGIHSSSTPAQNTPTRNPFFSGSEPASNGSGSRRSF
jgi:penicillin-binding protein 1A